MKVVDIFIEKITNTKNSLTEPDWTDFLIHKIIFLKSSEMHVINQFQFNCWLTIKVETKPNLNKTNKINKQTSQTKETKLKNRNTRWKKDEIESYYVRVLRLGDSTICEIDVLQICKDDRSFGASKGALPWAAEHSGVFGPSASVVFARSAVCSRSFGCTTTFRSKSRSLFTAKLVLTRITPNTWQKSSLKSSYRVSNTLLDAFPRVSHSHSYSFCVGVRVCYVRRAMREK